MRPVPAGAADDIGTAVFNKLSVATDRRRSLVIPRTRECIVLSTVMSCYSFADSKVDAVEGGGTIVPRAEVVPGENGGSPPILDYRELGAGQRPKLGGSGSSMPVGFVRRPESTHCC